MIAKGKCRAAPAQLASYLLRVQTRDGEQRVEVLELQSGTDSLRETFLDWHSVGLGTRGEKTLYHAQISPDPRYKMTPEQYLRAADILGEELGLQNHPRVIVLHDDGEQPHLHIVWQRADVETMTMWDDGNNYRKHEQASLRMEQEFGQDFVPGKHAKRDREQQPEFPRAESTQDEQKQAQRTDMTFDERKEQITALRQSADNAQAFKNALEETGYVLAKGDRRGFVVIDEQGEVFSLSKHVGDLKDKAFKEFMSPIDRDQLPSVDEAKAQQQDRLSARQQAQETVVEKQPPPAPLPEEQQPKRTGEALRALKAQLAAMKAAADSPQAFTAAVEKAGYVLASGDRGYTVVDENGGAYNLARQLKLKLAEVNEFMAPIDLKTLPSVDEAKALQRERALNAEKPAPEASKFLAPELAEKIEPPAPAPAKAEEPRSTEDSTVQPPPPAPETPVQPPPLDAELEALKKAIADSQAKDAQKWADFNALELRQLEYDLTRMNDGKAEDFDAIQAVEMKALRDRQKERRTGIKGVLDAIQSKLNPTLAVEKAKERSREVAQLKARQALERKDYLALIEQTKQLEIENLQERHALQRSQREHKNEEDQERFIEEHHKAKRILEEQRIKEELKHNDSLRDGPPPPKMGK